MYVAQIKFTKKALNCKLFRDIFNVECDEDFVMHKSASMQAVHDWTNGRGSGPDPDDLQFNMRGLHHDPWNSKVVEILMGKFVEAADEAGLPDRPDNYIKTMIGEKFQRCQKVWRRLRPQVTESGGLETPEDAEARVNDRKEVVMKAQRQATRRRNVSPPSFSLAHLLILL